MHSQTGVQLPVAYNQVDASCFNNSLPHGNDKWPQVNFLPGADQQLGGFAIATFRAYAQTRAQKSPIHCFCYNLLQLNQFNNQVWQSWCQYVVDFCDFLQRGQGQPPAQAADKAAARIYQCMLATTIQQYPAIRQFLDAGTQTGLNDAAALAGQITNDINQWKMRVQSGGMPQQMGMPVMGMAGGQVMGMTNQNAQAFAVTGVGQTPGYNNPAGPANTGGDSGMLLGSNTPSKPTSSWPSVAPTGQIAAQPQGMAPMNKQQPAASTSGQQSDIVDHNHKAPASVEDVVIDPNYYVPRGHVVNPDRPFDVIRNPGGVEIRPAHLVKWKRTVGSDTPYAKLYNPNTHICFLVKWADGVVKEAVVSLTPEMDYLKHEINEELRRKAMRPKGLNVPLQKYTVSDDLSVKTVEQTKQALDEGVITKEHLSPVAVEGYLTGTTDLENEAMARAAVMSGLDLQEGDALPPHEYITAQMHELDINEDCYNALRKFKDYTTPQEVVGGLKALVESGLLSLRYFTFINQRLTKNTNEFLRDSLSLETIQIEDYFEDGVALGPYLANKRGKDYETVYVGNTQSIVGRSLSLASEEQEAAEGEATSISYCIVDEYLNFQLGVPSEELSNLNLTKEACLVSPISHPNIIGALRAMTERARSLDGTHRFRMRLVTSDGFYYNVVVGKLVKGALLLKKA